MLEGIILAGGFGTRLKDIVPNLPKPMAPIGETPFLEILLSQLAQKGFSTIILSLGYKSEVIIDYFGSSFRDVKLSYVVEDKPLGTGGAIRMALEHVVGDHAYVFNGDTFLDLEIPSVERFWNDVRKAIIVGMEVEDTSRYGRLIIDNGKITGFAEKGISGQGLINAGCYVLERNELADFPLGSAFSIEEAYFSRIVNLEPINLFETTGTFIDIGIPEDYVRAQKLLTRYQ